MNMEKVRKIGKVQAVIILALIVAVVMLLPIPMSRSRVELFATTETYYDEVPVIVNESVLVPYSVTETVQVQSQSVKNMHWQVTWFIVLEANPRQFASSIGTQTFDGTFRYDWGTGYLYDPYQNRVGFRAEATFYLESAGMYTFYLASDDGSRLYMDGQIIANLWTDGVHGSASSPLQYLYYVASGWHSLVLEYYQWITNAWIRFDVDKGDLLTWEETQTSTIDVPKIYYNEVLIPRIQIQQVPKQRTTVENRTVTETVYVNLVEYIMKGGKP
jgi:hypothetical protein